MKGSDGEFHYSGAVKEKPDGTHTIGQTFEDGTVLIFKEAFEIAVKYKNPAYLASVLYHESRHFDQLSREATDGSTQRRSWSSTEEDERDAFEANRDVAMDLGLDTEDYRDLDALFRANDSAIRNGRMTPRSDDPVKQRRRMEYYEHVQLNLEDEYQSLKNTVDSERSRQEAMQKQIQDEANRRRSAPTEEEKWADIRAMAQSCGYRVEFARNNGPFMGFVGLADNEYFFFTNDSTQLDMVDLEAALLVARTCHEIENNMQRPSPKACNASAWRVSDLAGHPNKLNYMFRQPRSACVNDVFTRANEFTTTDSFNRFISDYHKLRQKARREYDKIWNSPSPPPRNDPPRSENPRPPANGGNDRYWDPGCQCWTRRY